LSPQDAFCTPPLLCEARYPEGFQFARGQGRPPRRDRHRPPGDQCRPADHRAPVPRPDLSVRPV